MSSIMENLKILRERTGAGILECKKALTEAKNNVEAAIDNLRKSGLAKVVKKASRIAAEGVVMVKHTDDYAAMIEINCETDFVAKDKNLISYANALIGALNPNTDVENFDQVQIDGKTVADLTAELVAKIGEKITFRRPTVIESKTNSFASYSHGGKIGVLVEYAGSDTEVAKGIAMQIAAMNPLAIEPKGINEEIVQREREIIEHKIAEFVKKTGKTQRNAEAELLKVLEGMTLLGQNHIIEAKKTVANVLKESNTSILKYIRFEVGEGIEKKQDNFVEEVMSQVKR